MNTDTSKQIPIEAFANFDRCLLIGAVAGIRWDAAMEAFEQARKQRLQDRKEGNTQMSIEQTEMAATKNKAPGSNGTIVHSSCGAIENESYNCYGPDGYYGETYNPSEFK